MNENRGRYSFNVSFNAPSMQVADKIRQEIESLDWTRPLNLSVGRLMIECDTRGDHEIGVQTLRVHGGPKIQFQQVPVDSEARRVSPGLRFARWDGKPKRKPRKGELYLSGAHPMAYTALADMESEYFIAVPVMPEQWVGG